MENKPFALIIEDDRGIAALFRHVLDLAGFQTEVVFHGQAAVERLSISQPDLALENGALNHTANKQVDGADTTVTLKRAVFDEVILGGKPQLEAKISSGDIKIEGQKESLSELMSLMDKFDPWFNIVTP